MGRRGRAGRRGDEVGLVGRGPECAVLGETIEAARAGRSRVLVLHGAPGVGKSALLDFAASAAAGMRVLRAAGVESEMELAFATLHQLCAPLLDRLAGLPAPQREALETVFAMRAGSPPERFLVGLAVLSLLSDASGEHPLLCVVDDEQWMDQASAQALGFVARRLLAEPVALVFASRRRSKDLLRLPELEVTGLKDTDAHALLESVTRARLDKDISERFVAETHGNPLALLELSRGLTAMPMAAGFGLMPGDALPGRIEESFLARIEALPEQTRTLLLIAAAEPTGDPDLVRHAAERLGITLAAALEDGTDGLLTIEARVIFRHPLVRSAVYRAAEASDRRAAHLALAEATDAQADPDRRAWHLASAAARPDEAVAAELERSAGRAQARGGLAAAAAFLRRSVALTIDAPRRAERAVAAADASLQAGDLDSARLFADIVDRDAQSESLRARAQLVRGMITFAAGLDDQAPPLLLAAARRLEPLDMELARETYLTAWCTATLATADADSAEAISRAMRRLSPPHGGPRALDLVIEGYALLSTDGRGAAVPVLQKGMTALKELPVQDFLTWGWAACSVSPIVWDDRGMREIFTRVVDKVRAVGALTELPLYLSGLGTMTVLHGEFAAAAAIVAESEGVDAATGVPMAQYTRHFLTAMQGKETEAAALIATAIERASADGQLNAVAGAQWAAAVLYNGLARHERALPAARAGVGTANLILSQWMLPELVEAAARTGDQVAARGALDGMIEAAEPCDTDWAQGMLARCRALLSDGAEADGLYREAIERLERTLLRPDLARAHLLYGEWLRLGHRRAEARDHLRTAHEMFTSIGMQAFAGRARHQLHATGEAISRHSAKPRALGDALTDQEAQIARLAAEGLTNPEIGAQLFISARTAEYHLRKVFLKLGITSRRQLRAALLESTTQTA